jgi:molecular chaperone GrpE
MVKDQKQSAEGNGNPAAATKSAPESELVSSAADQKIAELETQLQDANQRALRAGAELENYRKRTQREMADERRYAVVPLVRDLLPVIDNFQRAIEATPTRSVSDATPTRSVSEGAKDDSLLEGVKMVAAQLEAVLKQHGCVRIDAVGEPFDPNLHQAIAQEPSSEHAAGAVTRATQVGYKLHDRVIRPAQVFVSTGPGK